MKKKYIAITLMTLFSLTLVAPFKANAMEQKVATIMEGNLTYAPINSIVVQMGGQVQRDNVKQTTTITINGKTIKIDDNFGFAEVNGQFVPYETKDIQGFKIPVFKKPVVKDGVDYVPVEFLQSSVGLKLNVTNGKVTFEKVEGGNSTSVATVTVPNSGSQSSSNSSSSSSTGVVESNRPANNPSTPSSGSSSSGSTATPTPAPVQHQTIYTGSEVKQKVYSLGFFNKGGGLALNPYGSQGADQYDYMTFGVLSGDYDMHMTIIYSTPETDQKLRTILNWILPTQGSHMYSILDDANLRSQTITLDGRKVEIDREQRFISIDFGPIVK